MRSPERPRRAAAAELFDVDADVRRSGADSLITGAVGSETGGGGGGAGGSAGSIFGLGGHIL